MSLHFFYITEKREKTLLYLYIHTDSHETKTNEIYIKKYNCSEENVKFFFKYINMIINDFNQSSLIN
jgi:hypothetical protein